MLESFDPSLANEELKPRLPSLPQNFKPKPKTSIRIDLIDKIEKRRAELRNREYEKPWMNNCRLAGPTTDDHSFALNSVHLLNRNLTVRHKTPLSREPSIRREFTIAQNLARRGTHAGLTRKKLLSDNSLPVRTKTDVKSRRPSSSDRPKIRITDLEPSPNHPLEEAPAHLEESGSNRKLKLKVIEIGMKLPIRPVKS
jgi:hypothetical protein